MRGLTVEQAAELQRASLAGDRDATHALVESVKGVICRIAERTAHDRGFDDLDDAVGEAVAMILENGVRKYDPSRGTTWSAYAGRIAYNRISEGPVPRGRRRREPSVGASRLGLASLAADASPGPEHEVDEADARRRIHAEVDALPGPTRVAVILRFGLDGRPPCTLSEVGAALGVTKERARQRIDQGLERLRRSPFMEALR